jgi:hypothetical protein
MMNKTLLLVMGVAAMGQAQAGADDLIFLNGFDQFQQPVAGTVIISEIMSNPAGVEDSVGEWFELTSVAQQTFYLGGCTVAGSGGSPNTLPQYALQAGAIAVLARSDDMATNGGIDAFTSFNFALAASGTLTLKCGKTVIDATSWTNESAGHSRQLDVLHFDAISNDDPANWCLSTIPYNTDNTGSPGAGNEQCPAN